MQREIRIGAAQSSDEVVLECLDRAFAGVAAIDVWWDQLEVNVDRCHVVLERSGGFIVQLL